MKERLKIFFNNKYTITLLFNLGVLAVLMLIACPKYSNDIDILMQSILYGVGSAGPDSHLIFSSILVGKTLKMLLSLAPGIAWYTVMQFALVFVSLCTITYTFLHKPHNLTKRLIVLFFLCFMGYECYITPSYVKTAVVLSVAAFCLLVDTMKGCARPKVRYIWCVVLLWGASLISFRICLVATAICVGGILILYLRKKDLKFCRFGVAAIAIAVLLAASSEGVEYYKYSSDETYSAEKVNAQAIEKLYAFGYPDYSSRIEEQTGLNKEEYNALTSGRFVSYNENVTYYFKTVSEISNRFGAKTVVKFFRMVPIRMLGIALFLGCVILVSLAYLSNRKNKRILIMSIVMWLVMYGLLYIGNAWLGAAVPMLVLSPICALAMTQYGELANKHVKELVVFGCIFAIIMYTNFSSKIVTSVNTGSMEQNYMSSYNPDEVQVADIVSYIKQFTIFRAYPEGLFDDENVCIVNGIYRDVHGFEKNIYFNSELEQNSVKWYSEKAEKLLIK